MAKIINTEKPKTYQSALEFYMEKIGKTELLTRQDEITLARGKEEGIIEDRQKLVKSNTRLAFKIAKGFSFNHGLDPEEFEDLIQEGNTGLIRGIDKLDPDKEKVSTYVSWWIKQACERALYSPGKVVGGEFKGSYRLMKLKQQIKISWHEFVRKYNRQPNTKELLEFTSERTGKSIDRVEQAFGFQINLPSLNDNLGETDEFLIDMIPNYECERPEDVFNKAEMDAKFRILEKYLARIKKTEADALRLRYGMGNEEIEEKYGLNKNKLEDLRYGKEKKVPLKIVGELLGKSPETIRQMEKKALEKLRYLILKDPEYELFLTESENPFASEFTDFEHADAGKSPERKVSVDKYNFWEAVGEEMKKMDIHKPEDRVQRRGRRKELKLFDTLSVGEIQKQFLYLTKKQHEAIQLSYGINDKSLRTKYGITSDGELTYEEISSAMGVTKQAVSASKTLAEAKILKTISNPNRKKGTMQEKRRERIGDMELARRVLSNIDSEDREVINILYKIDEEALERDYGMNHQRSTYRLASELTGVSLGNIPYREQRGLRELKKFMALAENLDI